MDCSVAYQHTDGYRNHDGSDIVYGIKKVGTDRNLLVPYSIIFGSSHKKSLAKLCRMASTFSGFLIRELHSGQKK